MSTRDYTQALERAKRRVIEAGRVNVFAYVCRERQEFGPDRAVVLSGAEYEESGDEDTCVAAVWSYADGEYDAAGVFRPSGRIAAAVEEY